MLWQKYNEAIEGETEVELDHVAGGLGWEGCKTRVCGEDIGRD